ncbi:MULTISPECIES: zinc metallochaperone AztD [unclassified Nocardioides]|uniref:zinc metallochaperone AztD n=1 Tax=unclassified Nocardioides TaxID=2615069 RepID=UPI000AFB0B65|nr:MULTISPECIES: zinc metallochaperone AztD [unclassified Nocardioides]
MLIKSSALALLSTLALVGCGTEESTSRSRDDAPATDASATEVKAPAPRLAMTYDGGVAVLDAATGEVLLEEEIDGFLRLNPAGDDRHLFVSAAGGLTALDLGAWTDDHGDHGHSWTTDPRLTDFTIAAEEPGHVVPHHGRTTVFDDGTGIVTAFDPADLAALEDGEPALDTWTLDEAHHGVAVQDGHGNLIHTVGDAEARSGIRLVTAAGNELASSDQCPGVHGEAFAGDVALFGCEDGVLVVDGRRITKIDSPDSYGRIGNQAGHEDSPYVLGDYKVDRDAELERPTRVSVIDTRNASLRLVDLPASYSFRSLARTPDGDALVLGTDGRLHVIDPASARITASIPVTKAWREPTDWHEARPTVQVIGEVVYVTEPVTRQIHVIDLATRKVERSIDVAHTPNELSGVAG